MLNDTGSSMDKEFNSISRSILDLAIAPWVPGSDPWQVSQLRWQRKIVAPPPPPPCNSYAKVPNEYGPYAYYSLDKGVACAQHIQLPTHT